MSFIVNRTQNSKITITVSIARVLDLDARIDLRLQSNESNIGVIIAPSLYLTVLIDF